MTNFSVVGILIGGIALGGTFGFAAGSKTKSVTKTTESTESTESLTCSVGGETKQQIGTVVEIDGKTYTQEDLPQDIKSAIYETQHENHEKTAWIIKEFALRFALAKDKTGNTSVDKLPSLQELLPPTKIDDATLKAFYETNKAQVPPGTTYEQVKPQLEQYLSRQSMSASVQTKLAEMEKAGKIKFLLKEPIPPVVNLDLEGLPSQGPKDATVTFVEASDYLCPHCQKMQPEVEEVIKTYEGKIRFVQVNFALNQEGTSGMLAQGAYCAQKQSIDLFWKFHHDAFGAKQTSPTEAKKETLAIAEKVGVKNEAFEKCLGSEEAKTFVAKLVEKMSRAGITGTPSFFLNGRKLGHQGNLKDSVASALEGIK